MYGMDLSALKDNASATQSFLDFQFQTPDMGTDNFFYFKYASAKLKPSVVTFHPYPSLLGSIS